MGANHKRHPQYKEIQDAIRVLYPEGGSAPITKLYKIPRTHVVRMAWQMGVKMTDDAKAKQALENARSGGKAAAAKAKHRRVRGVPAMQVWREEADPLEKLAICGRRV